MKEGLTVLNTPGTIDPSYRGEIAVILANLSGAPKVVTKGERIAQLVVKPVEYPIIKVVDKLDSTDRGEDGLGSTGKT